MSSPTCERGSEDILAKFKRRWPVPCNAPMVKPRRRVNAQMKLNSLIAVAISVALAASGALPLAAQGRDNVLIAVGEQGPSSLDTHNPVANDYTRLVAWNVYDRLVRHGMKENEDGVLVYDISTFEPELATSWEISEDGTEYTFKLREDAVFHDGTPVTAEDVKWSFDRAVAAGGFPAIQMGASYFLEAEQFEAVDEHTFRINMPTPNKYVMANLTVPVPVIVNKDLALEPDSLRLAHSRRR